MEKRGKYPRPIYHQLFSRSLAERDRISRSFPFLEIGLSRSPSLGTSPVDELVLHRHGGASYQGIAYVARIGHFEGRVPLNAFGKLCYLLEDLDIGALRPSYRAPGTDRASTVLRVVRADESVFSIRDYGNSGPIRLWAVQQTLRALCEAVHWTPRVHHGEAASTVGA